VQVATELNLTMTKGSKWIVQWCCTF